MTSASIAFAAVFLLSAFGVGSAADVPYYSYTFNYWRQAVPAPQAYVPARLIDSSTLGVELGDPKDLFSIGDRTYILDSGGNKIVCVDADFRVRDVIASFHRAGRTETFNKPEGIFVTPDGHIYVADTGNKRVVKYDAQGAVLGVVGGAGPEAGRFQEPVGLAVGPDGNLYVADTWNQRVQVFSPALEFVREWPVYAWEGASVVNKPYIAVDGDGHVVVSDPEGYRLLEFDPQGELVAAWGQFGADLAGMNLPTGLAFGPDGALYVADAENGRVLVFAGEQNG